MYMREATGRRRIYMKIEGHSHELYHLANGIKHYALMLYIKYCTDLSTISDADHQCIMFSYTCLARLTRPQELCGRYLLDINIVT